MAPQRHKPASAGARCRGTPLGAGGTGSRSCATGAGTSMLPAAQKAEADLGRCHVCRRKIPRTAALSSSRRSRRRTITVPARQPASQATSQPASCGDQPASQLRRPGSGSLPVSEPAPCQHAVPTSSGNPTTSNDKITTPLHQAQAKQSRSSTRQYAQDEGQGAAVLNRV